VGKKNKNVWATTLPLVPNAKASGCENKLHTNSACGAITSRELSVNTEISKSQENQ
jgi:hypothetical protein